MSVRVSNWVWENSGQSASSLLVLLALADHAHDNGSGAYPSMATLARKVRMSPRQVRRIVHAIAQDGEIIIDERRGRGHANLYSFTFIASERAVSEDLKSDNSCPILDSVKQDINEADFTDDKTGQDDLVRIDKSAKITDLPDTEIGQIEHKIGHSGPDNRTELSPTNRHESSLESSLYSAADVKDIVNAVSEEPPEVDDFQAGLEELQASLAVPSKSASKKVNPPEPEANPEPISEPAPEPVPTQELEPPEPTKEKPKWEPPEWWTPLTVLPGYRNISHHKLCYEIFLPRCKEEGVDPAEVVRRFAKYYTENHRYWGWSDPASAFRKNYGKTISQMEREQNQGQGSDPPIFRYRRKDAESKAPIRPTRRI